MALDDSLEEIINKERKKNWDFYKKHEKEFYEKYKGKYMVIANEEVKAVSDNYDDIKFVALDYDHRFIFKVEKKEKKIGYLGRPDKGLKDLLKNIFSKV